MTSLLLATLIAAQSAGVGARPAPPSDQTATSAPRPASIRFLRVVYDERGGTPATGYYSRSEDFTAYIHTVNTICSAGRDSQTRPTDAAFGWEITGKFISRTPSEVVVQLNWRRAWENGQATREPSGSINLALHPGERVPLDRITTTAVPGACRGIGMTLSVEFSNGTSMVGAAASGGGEIRGGGTGGTGAGAFGGGGARGGTAGTGGPEGRAGQTQEYFEQLAKARAAAGNSSVRMTSPSGEASVSSDLDPRTLQTVTAEIWLVHRLPNGTEESQFLSVQTVPGQGTFEFPAVTLTFWGSSHSVDVKGFVQAQRLPDGSENLEVGLVRRVSALTPTPRGLTLGSTGRKVAMPQRGQVLSFEMPDDSNATLGGHQFSIRVRVPR